MMMRKLIVEYPGWGPGSVSIRVHTFLMCFMVLAYDKKASPPFFFTRLGKSRTNFFFTLGAEIGVIRSFFLFFCHDFIGLFLFLSISLMFALLSFFGPYGLGWLFLGFGCVSFRLKFG